MIHRHGMSAPDDFSDIRRSSSTEGKRREESTTDPIAVSKELIEELDNGTYLIWQICVRCSKAGAKVA